MIDAATQAPLVASIEVLRKLLRSIVLACEAADVDYSLRKRLRRLLRQVVAYAAGNVAMLILAADVLLGIDARVSVRRERRS